MVQAEPTVKVRVEVPPLGRVTVVGLKLDVTQEGSPDAVDKVRISDVPT